MFVIFGWLNFIPGKYDEVSENMLSPFLGEYN
jgi:hypothetical protein